MWNELVFPRLASFISSHKDIQLFRLKLSKNQQFMSSGTLATFQVLSSHTQLVVKQTRPSRYITFRHCRNSNGQIFPAHFKDSEQSVNGHSGLGETLKLLWTRAADQVSPSLELFPHLEFSPDHTLFHLVRNPWAVSYELTFKLWPQTPDRFGACLLAFQHTKET